jgi:hypothetical protein
MIALRGIMAGYWVLLNPNTGLFSSCPSTLRDARTSEYKKATLEMMQVTAKSLHVRHLSCLAEALQLTDNPACRSE